MRTYRTVEEQLRDLLHDEQAEGDRLWRMGESLRLKHEKLEHDYNEVVMMLCATEERLAEVELAWDNDPRLGMLGSAVDLAEEQRDEARAIARELFAWIRSVGRVDTYYMSLREREDWFRVRPGVRRALEA